MSIVVDGTTSLLLVNSSTLVTGVPKLVYLSSVTQGHTITVRDSVGQCSATKKVIISTTADQSFAEQPTRSSFAITNPYGFFTFQATSPTSWRVLNSFAANSNQSAVNIFSTTGSTITASTTNLSFANISSLYVSTLSTASLRVENELHTSSFSTASLLANTGTIIQSATANSLNVASTVNTTSLTLTNTLSTVLLHPSTLSLISSLSTLGTAFATDVFASTLQGSTLVTSSIAQISTLNVRGLATFSNDVNFIDIFEINTFLNTTSFISIGQDLFVGRNILAPNATTFDTASLQTQQLITSNATIQSLSVNYLFAPSFSTDTLFVGGTLHVGGSNSELLSTMSIAGSLVVASNFILNSNFTIDTNLIVDGNFVNIGTFSTLSSAVLATGTSGRAINIAGSVSTQSNMSTGNSLLTQAGINTSSFSTVGPANFFSTVFAADVTTISSVRVGSNAVVGGTVTAVLPFYFQTMTVSSLIVDTTSPIFTLSNRASTLFQGTVSTVGDWQASQTITAVGGLSTTVLNTPFTFTHGIISTQSSFIVGGGLLVGGPATLQAASLSTQTLFLQDTFQTFSSLYVSTSAQFNGSITVNGNGQTTILGGTTNYNSEQVNATSNTTIVHNSTVRINFNMGINTQDFDTYTVPVIGNVLIASTIESPLTLTCPLATPSTTTGHSFQLYNTASQPTDYALIQGGILNSTVGQESGAFTVHLRQAGSLPSSLTDATLLLTQSTAFLNTSSVVFSFSSFVTSTNLGSTVTGLGSAGYVSSFQGSNFEQFWSPNPFNFLSLNSGDATNFSTILISPPIALSYDGGIQVTSLKDGNIYRSIDYGNTWNIIPAITGIQNLNIVAIAMSENGSTIGVGTTLINGSNTNYFYSSNGGDFWNQTTITGTSVGVIDLAISSDGVTQCALDANGLFYISVNSGVMWFNLSFGVPYVGANNLTIASSNSNFIAFTSNGVFYNDVYISNNQGLTFTPFNVPTAIPGALGSLSISSNGQYMLTGEINESSAGRLFLSSNYGSNWNVVFTETAGTTWSFFSFVYVSPSGQYQLAYNFQQRTFYSSANYGSNWSSYAAVPNFPPYIPYITAISGNSQVIAGFLNELISYQLFEMSNALTPIPPGPVVTSLELNASSINSYYVSTNIITKLVGTFDIPHPLGSLALPATRLVHSFIEGPRADLLYRGKTKLQAGEATVDLEREATANGSFMSPGTFEALATHPQVLLQNNSTYEDVRGSVSSHFLHIQAQTSTCEATVDWMVLAERHDPSMKAWNRCDQNGFLVLEYQN